MSQQQRRWGLKTAWAKQFFSLRNDALQEEAIPSAEPSKEPIPARRQALERKRLKKLELHPDTIWCCTRCGCVLRLPRDVTSGRPVVSLLAQHLEHRVHNTDGNDAEATATPPPLAVPACTAGAILFNPEDPAASVAGSSGRNGEFESSRCRPQNAHTDDDKAAEMQNFVCDEADRTKLLALFTKLTSSTTGAAPTPPLAETSVQSGPLVFIVVENPKTAANLGSVLRAMGCLCGSPAAGGESGNPAAATTCQANSRAAAFLYTGSRLDKACAFQRHQGQPNSSSGGGGSLPALSMADAAGGEAVGSTDAQKAAQHIQQLRLNTLQSLFDVLADVKAAHKDGSALSVCARTVAVDLIVGAQPLPTYTHPFALGSERSSTLVDPPSQTLDNDDSSLEEQRKEQTTMVFYCFGPEDGSLSQSFLQQCDEAVFMPTIGSLNLAASVNVLLYDRVAKDYAFLHRPRQDDELSRKRVRGGVVEPAVDNDDSLYFAHRNANNHLVWSPPSPG